MAPFAHFARKPIARLSDTLQYKTMERPILRTCRQIYEEAVSILYSQNVFEIIAPGQMFTFMAQVGPKNIKFVRSLWILVPWHGHEIASWLSVLNAVAEKATGLRFLWLGWDAECEFPWQFKPGHQPRGLGKNVQFVQALAKIKQVKKLIIHGFYAKNWPSYLRKEMGVQIHAECDQYIEPSKYVAEESVWIPELREIFLEKLKFYQEGTEDLMP